MNGFSDKVSFIWSVADLLRGPYKPAQYGKVILPLTVLRRLDCVLEPTKAEVLVKYESLRSGTVKNLEPIGLVELPDLGLKAEVLDDLARPRAEACDVLLKVGGDVGGIVGELWEIQAA